MSPNHVLVHCVKFKYISSVTISVTMFPSHMHVYCVKFKCISPLTISVTMFQIFKARQVVGLQPNL